VNEFCSIPIRVWDTKEKVWVDDHPINGLLKRPSAFSTTNEFLRNLAINYLVTGNSFLVQTGDLNRPPLEINNVSPMNLTINRAQDGHPGNYQVTTTAGSIIFDRTPVTSRDSRDRLGDFRFVDRTGGREIWQARTFNPTVDAQSGSFFGLSPLTAVFYEIKQFIESSVHNWSLLKRGARPTGAMSSEQQLTDDQFQKLQAEINNQYTGSENSGRPYLLENGMKWIEMSMTNRDMDFMGLKKMVSEALYNQYKIPLPLISGDQMTLNNLETANLSLFDNAVVPLTKYLYSELTLFTLRRYPGSEDLILSFDPHDIPALEGRRIEGVEKLSRIGVLTTNELRAKLGYEEVDGGSDILKPANLLPLMNDQFTGDNLDKPRPRTPRKQFEDLVEENFKNSEYSPTFEKINEIAKKNGLS
jgi:phage portal protein BeeE